MADAKVVFDDAAAYERFMGRWSRAVGEKFLAWLDPPSEARWLDVGCGTGAFSNSSSTECAPRASPASIRRRRRSRTRARRLPQVKFEVGDALALPFGDGEFDIVASALVLHFLPDRAKAFDEMRRVLAAKGMVAGYTWNRTADSTLRALCPNGARHQEPRPALDAVAARAGGGAGGLQATLRAAGFDDIVIDLIEATESYRDFDEYWEVQTLSVSSDRQEHRRAFVLRPRHAQRHHAQDASGAERWTHQLFVARHRLQGEALTAGTAGSRSTARRPFGRRRFPDTVRIGPAQNERWRQSGDWSRIIRDNARTALPQDNDSWRQPTGRISVRSLPRDAERLAIVHDKLNTLAAPSRPRNSRASSPFARHHQGD